MDERFRYIYIVQTIYYNYIGFIKKHPHDTNSIIRIAYNPNVDFDINNDTNIYKMVKFSCDIGKNIFANIKEYF